MLAAVTLMYVNGREQAEICIIAGLNEALSLKSETPGWLAGYFLYRLREA